MPFLPTERKQYHRAGTAGEVNKVRQYPRYCNFRGRKPSPENGPGGKTANNADDGRVRHKICRPFSGTVRTGRTGPTAAKAENGRPPSAGRRSRRSFRARSGSGENLPSEQRPDTEPTHRPEQAAGRVNPFRHGKKRQQPCTAHRCDVRPVLHHSFRHGPAKSDGRHHQIAVRRLEPPVPARQPGQLHRLCVHGHSGGHDAPADGVQKDRSDGHRSRLRRRMRHVVRRACGKLRHLPRRSLRFGLLDVHAQHRGESHAEIARQQRKRATSSFSSARPSTRSARR